MFFCEGARGCGFSVSLSVRLYGPRIQRRTWSWVKACSTQHQMLHMIVAVAHTARCGIVFLPLCLFHVLPTLLPLSPSPDVLTWKHDTSFQGARSQKSDPVHAPRPPAHYPRTAAAPNRTPLHVRLKTCAPQQQQQQQQRRRRRRTQREPNCGAVTPMPLRFLLSAKVMKRPGQEGPSLTHRCHYQASAFVHRVR